MLYTSPNLCTAHFYKEDFLKILDCQDRQSARKAMSDWINSAYDCGIPRFVKCAKTMQNWLTGILDSFTIPLTNGFIEGCNNKIKVLKKKCVWLQRFQPLPQPHSTYVLTQISKKQYKTSGSLNNHHLSISIILF